MGGVRSGPGAARTILLFHIISARPSQHPRRVRTFLKVYMELDSYFLFLQEQNRFLLSRISLRQYTRRHDTRFVRPTGFNRNVTQQLTFPPTLPLIDPARADPKSVVDKIKRTKRKVLRERLLPEKTPRFLP